MQDTSVAILDLVTQHLMPADFDQLSPGLREALIAWMGTRSISYDEFVRSNTQPHAEWVDGSVVTYTESSQLHTRTLHFLQTILGPFADVRGLGLVRTGFQVRLGTSVRVPDLIFMANSHLDCVKATYVSGAPDLIVEVVDSNTAGADRGAKFYEYERAGVREYWLIDPRREWAEFYVVDRIGRYQPAVVGDAGIFRSRVVRGFWICLEWLWDPPQPMQALRELSALVR